MKDDYYGVLTQELLKRPNVTFSMSYDPMDRAMRLTLEKFIYKKDSRVYAHTRITEVEIRLGVPASNRILELFSNFDKASESLTLLPPKQVLAIEGG